MATDGVSAPAYSERYVAFVDVLGFRNIITRSGKEARVVAEVWEAMNGISERALNSRSADMQATSFSDNVVLSVPAVPDGLRQLFETIGALSADLLRRNMLFRGAVVRGNIIHDSNVVFGPALVQAYLLETNTAFHPRIMLDGTVYDDCERFAADGKPECRTFVSADAHDVPYLDPFVGITTSDEGETVEALVQLLSVIAAGLTGSAGQPSVSEKYKWLARKFDSFVVRRGLDKKTGVIGVDD